MHPDLTHPIWEEPDDGATCDFHDRPAAAQTTHPTITCYYCLECARREQASRYDSEKYLRYKAKRFGCSVRDYLRELDRGPGLPAYDDSHL